MFELPQLPYDLAALEPFISTKTLDFHYNKHHKTYLDNLNNLVKDTPFAVLSLEEVILKTSHNPSDVAIFNNAAQVWNHSFFWRCLKKNGGGELPSNLASLIEKSFESVEAFKAELKNAALTQFGSGWAWLVMDDEGGLKVIKTANADTPIARGLKPLLTIDVWEHAYYLDYQNKRADFVQTCIDNLINWDFVSANLEK